MNNDTRKEKPFEIKHDEEKIKDAIELMKIYYNIVHENSKQIFRIRGFYVVAISGIIYILYIGFSKFPESEPQRIELYIAAIALTLTTLVVEGIITSWQTLLLTRIKEVDEAIQKGIKIEESSSLTDVFKVPHDFEKTKIKEIKYLPASSIFRIISRKVKLPEENVNKIYCLIGTPSLIFFYSSCWLIIGVIMFFDYFLNFNIIPCRMSFLLFLFVFFIITLSILIPILLFRETLKLGSLIKY